MEPKIHVTIKNRQNIYFDGEVNAITSFNDLGLFDILPKHENFISLIKNKIILHNKSEKKELKIDQGLLKVRDNKVDIYLGI